MKIKPILDNVLLIEEKREETSKSGIVIPDSIEGKKNNIGKIIGIGEKVTEVEIGDRVLFDKYGIEEIELDGNAYLVCKEKDIISKLE